MFTDTSVFPSKSILNKKFVQPKRTFDPSRREDLLAYKEFITNSSWGSNGCPFELEWPHLTIPSMLAEKISAYYVNKAIK